LLRLSSSHFNFLLCLSSSTPILTCCSRPTKPHVNTPGKKGRLNVNIVIPYYVSSNHLVEEDLSLLFIEPDLQEIAARKVQQDN
jgi:hypothetical protein